MFGVIFTGLAAIAATQQTAPPATSANEIVVTGRGPIDRDVALRTVTDITVVNSDLQLARFRGPVCPAVAGLSAEPTRALEDRIRATARQVGAQVAERGCEANLMVFFSDDGGKLVSEMRTKRPKWFAGMTAAKVDLVEKGDGPVRSWSATSIRNEDGKLAQADGDRAGPASMEVKGASMMRRQSRLHIDASMIVIDRSAAKGRTVDEIAGYVAMRGLAMTKPPSQGGADTILTAFSSPRSNAARTLTNFDVGYLTALYRGTGAESAVEERNRIARALSS